MTKEKTLDELRERFIYAEMELERLHRAKFGFIEEAGSFEKTFQEKLTMLKAKEEHNRASNEYYSKLNPNTFLGKPELLNE
jgi:hypothetical protein